MLEFEFDEKKSSTNKIKHGIDFIEAQKLFNQENVFIQRAKTIDNEDRFALIGMLEEKCYVAIFTFRINKIRLISVRRCRKKEKETLQNYDKNES